MGAAPSSAQLSGETSATNVLSGETTACAAQSHPGNETIVALPPAHKLIAYKATRKEIPVSRGNRVLGVVEIVDVLEAMAPMIERLVRADGRITPDEQRLIDTHNELIQGSQALAMRTQIATSLLRGLEEPPARVNDLIDELLPDLRADAVAGHRSGLGATDDRTP